MEEIGLLPRAASAAMQAEQELQGLPHTQCFWVPDTHQLRSRRHLPHRASSSHGCVHVSLTGFSCICPEESIP